ncbi:MAG: O-antigen ligase family protein, partial [Parcubacteria group bacterium]|nr:O-antigen ligase family protein [Parcubacteria group bacterium]
SWVSGAFLFIFFLLVFNRGFVKIVFTIIPVLIIIFGIYYYLDSKLAKSLQTELILAKAKDLEVLAKEFFAPNQKSFIPDRQKPSDKEIFVPDQKSFPDRQKPSAYVLPSTRYKRKDNLTWRLDIWWQSIHFGLKSPIFGRGFGVYPRYIVWGSFKPPPKDIGVGSGVIPTHNHLVSIFYKMGFLGLVLFLFINSYVFIYGLRYIKRCNADFTRYFLISSLGAFVFWHTMALFFDIIDSPPTSIFLWIIMGFIFSAVEIDKTQIE